MTVFVMDDESVQKLHAVAKYAEAHPVPIEEMKARNDAFKAGREIEPFSEDFQAVLPFGYRVVFTIEEHPLHNDAGTAWLRHMSMSSPRDGRVPIAQVITWVMGQLGYTTPLEKCITYPEDTGQNSFALNVMEEYRAAVVATALS